MVCQSSNESYVNLPPSIAAGISQWQQTATALLNNNNNSAPALMGAPALQGLAGMVAATGDTTAVVKEKIKWYVWLILAVVLSLLATIVAIVTIRLNRS